MKKILLFLMLSCVMLFVSCDFITITPTNTDDEDQTIIKNTIENNVTNNITNEITNKVVDSTLNYTVEDLENAVEECVVKVQDSVIGVSRKAKVPYKDKDGNTRYSIDKESIGSGVVYKKVELDAESDYLYKYYVITNAHVVTCDAKDGYDHLIYAYIGKDNVKLEYLCEVLGKDDKGDLAVISFETDLVLTVCEFADSETTTKGSFVIAVGNPDGYDYYNSVTFGVVSNVARYISMDTDDDGTNDFSGEFIQTDAAINPGNSGGGLFTLDGKLLGINSMKLASTSIDNMGFAIPSNIVQLEISTYLEQGLDYKRPRLGITMTEVVNMNAKYKQQYGIYEIPDACYIDQTPYGICVVSLSDKGSCVGGPIVAGDIILKIRPKGTDESNDVIIHDSSDLSGLLNSIDNDDYHVGKSVTITYYEYLTGSIKTADFDLIAVD